MSYCSGSNVSSAFIDLASLSSIENNYLYKTKGSATSFFLRQTRRSSWFTIAPLLLSKSNGNPTFGSDFSVTISRSGDYLLNTYLRLVLPAVQLNDGADPNLRLRWTRNVAHNLVRECCLTFNDLTAESLNNYYLDWWLNFTCPESKKVGYLNMIGSTDELQMPSLSLPAKTLNLPLPFFFALDSGCSLPTAAIPYNDIRLSFCLRDWTDLLIVDDVSKYAVDSIAPASRPATQADVKAVPKLTNVQVWSHYSIVSAAERNSMAESARDMVIQQVQLAPLSNFTPSTNPNPHYDMRFSHAVKALFFGARNNTNPSEWSNYTTGAPQLYTTASGKEILDFEPSGASDPVSSVSLLYENTSRLQNMGADYFSLIQPFYFANSVPQNTGYHIYSYSLNMCHVAPEGSTNYGRLTNTTLCIDASKEAVAASKGEGSPQSGAHFPQTFTFLILCCSLNVLRVAGGSVGEKMYCGVVPLYKFFTESKLYAKITGILGKMYKSL